MKQVVRAFLRNEKWEFIMVRHKNKDHWSLPGWHIEKWENLYKAMKREIKEELDLKITILWNKLGLKIDHIKEKPAPLCSYIIEFESEKFWKIKKTEYIFLCEIKSWIIKIQEEEIDEYKFFTKNEILNLENTFIQVKEILKHID